MQSLETYTDEDIRKILREHLKKTVLPQSAYRLQFHSKFTFRFFDINELAALRVEDTEVFAFHHRLAFELIARGAVQGLRIDHPDGLYDPPAYFRALQKTYLLETEKNIPPEKLDRILKEEEFRACAPLFVVVEKILDRKESLPGNWNVQGTVGYDFLNVLNGLFVDPANENKFDELYEQFIGTRLDFESLIYQTKKFFALVHMPSEINMLAYRLDRISETNRRYRDFTLNNLTVAIREVIASFPVYRTYISPEDTEVSERDAKYIHIAIEKAKRRTPGLTRTVYDFLKQILTLKLIPEIGSEEEKQYRDFILRFQQLTGPIMAKGLEDTAFYIYNRLVSLNEVGGDPMHFGTSIGDFHATNIDRNKRWPAGFNASSTHDTKRSEDARMRLNALSEIPDEWASQLAKWALVNEKHKTEIGGVLFPRRNTEYFFYQALIAVWPNEETDRGKFRERIWNTMLKSAREAKLETNWVNPDQDYEAALKRFVDQVLADGEDNLFPKVFLPFQKKIAEWGMKNSLLATLLKVTAPGIPEIYQGCETWNYSLVDPDNRTPVDFETRVKNLEEIKRRGLASKDTKLYVLWKTLTFRKNYPEIFMGGDYIPLKVTGKKEKNIVAYMRKNHGCSAIVIAARFFSELSPDTDWEDTAVLLPPGDSKWKDVLSGKETETESSNALLVSPIFGSALSVALLTEVR